MRARTVVGFLFSLVLIGVLVFVVLIIAGVATLKREGDTIKGEVDLGKIEQSVDRAVEKTGATLEDTGEKMQHERTEAD